MKLVENWKELWKAWGVQIAALGLALPELLQFIADNTSSMYWLDDGWKSIIRMVCLGLVILVRPIKQESLHPDEKEKP